MNRDAGIAVLHYNKINLTIQCVDSVVGAGVPGDRIFCLDNGSDPDVYRQLSKRYPQVRHHRLETNRGFSGGFNAALTCIFEAGYETAVFLTNDTIFHPGADAALADILGSSGAGMAAPCIRYLSNPDRIDSLGAFFDPVSASLQHYHETDLPDFMEPGKDYIPGTALAITRTAFETLHGADESFHTYWEDVDLCFRAHKAAIRLVRCPGARIDHGVGRTCHKKPFYTTFLFQRNRLMFCRRHLNGSALQQAESVIRADWTRMQAAAREKNDRNRMNYLDQLMGLVGS